MVRVRVWGVSDLHTHHGSNADLVDAWAAAAAGSDDVGSDGDSGGAAAAAKKGKVLDVLVVAGDVGTRLDELQETLGALVRCGRWARVFFCPGNNELRLDRRSDRGVSADSVAKLDAVLQAVSDVGVAVGPEVIGKDDDDDDVAGGGGGGVLVAPLLAWYTACFSPAFDPEETGYGYQRRWLDFRACNWPADLDERCLALAREMDAEEEAARAVDGSSSASAAAAAAAAGASASKAEDDESMSDASSDSPGAEGAASSTGGSTVAFVQSELERVDSEGWPALYMKLRNDQVYARFSRGAGAGREDGGAAHVVTFSHFLPRFELRPLLAPNKTLQFVIGDTRVEDRLRQLGATHHIYGHTHVQGDTMLGGVRYVQNPLAHPHERTGLVHRRISGPMLVFDSKSPSAGNPGILSRAAGSAARWMF